MSLAYAAAEFFIQVLSKNANFSISFDKLSMHIEQANEDIISYLKEESQNDLLFIFKKFPDVFVLTLHSVSLTDAFLSLHAFPNLAHFSTQYASPFEKSVVEYFKLMLSHHGTCSAVQLFKMILSENIEEAAYHFAHYTTSDMQTFLKKYSNTFTVVNNNVYLNKNLYIDTKTFSLDDEMCSKYLKKLTGSVYFLLTCFKSLHYIELKQCISCVFSSVRQFLNQYSLIKQRQIFENFPETRMDEIGYLSLINYNDCLLKSHKSRLILIIVCMLAFETKMHFLKIAQEVKQRTLSEVNSLLCSLTISRQFNYFRSLPKYFVIVNSGYVSLSTAFVFPLCSFENSCQSLVESEVQVKPPVSCFEIKNLQNGAILPDFHSNELKHQNIEVAKHNFITKSLDISVNSQMCVNSISYLPQNYTVLNHRLRFSILFLLQSFDTTVYEIILKCVLHVLDDVRINFLNLSSIHQGVFIKECYRFYNTQIAKKEILKDLIKIYFGKKEKTLLFITYMLIEEGKIHFEKLTKLISNVIDDSFSSVEISDQYHYYKKEMAKYLTIYNDGYISLDSSFESVNSIITDYFGMVSLVSPSHKNTIEVNDQLNDDSNTNELSQFSSKSAESSNVTNFSDTIGIHTCDESLFNPECKSPDSLKFSLNIETDQQVIVYKRLQSTLFYLQNYYSPLSYKCVLETFFHSLIDVYNIFYKLSTGDQIKFIEKCFQFINTESVNEIANSDSQYTILKEDEKAVLLITYLLIKEKSLHFQNIVTRLKKFKIHFSCFNKNVSNQFKQFKNWNKFFVIKSDGYVCLNSSFFSVSSVVSAKISFIPDIKTKLNSNIEFRNPSNSDEKITQKVQKVSVLESETVENYSTPTNSSADVIDSIIDICVSILSVCDKMQIEKLCNWVNSCDVKDVQNYFSFYTIAEKIKFFKNVSLQFNVSKDGFVSLKQDTFVANVDKTCLTAVKCPLRGCSESEESTNNHQTIVSDTSEFSDSYFSHSSTENSRNIKKRRSRRGPRNRINSKVLSVKSTFNLKGNGTQSENFSNLHDDRVSKEIHSNSSFKSECNSVYIENSEGKAHRNVSEGNCKLNVPQENSENPKQNKIKTEIFLDGAVGDTDTVIKNVNFDSSPVKFNNLSYIFETNKDLKQNSVHSSASPSLKFDSSEIFDALSSSPNSDNLDSGKTEHNSSDSYDKELLNSRSGDLKTGNYETTSSSLADTTSFYNNKTSPKHFNSCYLAENESLVKNCDDPTNSSCNRTYLPSINCNTLPPRALKYDSGQNDSKPNSPEAVFRHSEDNVIELRAVNFFCVMLGKYDMGVSSDFLLNHINLASSEVQSFMVCNFKKDIISFFLKHNKFFYVSPQTHNISLVKSN